MVTQVLKNGDYISKAVSEVSEKAGDSGIPDGQEDSGKAEEPDTDDSFDSHEDNGTVGDGASDDVDLITGKYTKRQVQRMKNAEILALAGMLGIEISGTAAETREAVLRNLGL